MRDLLIELAETDRRLTAELGDGHPRVRELREANARELELIVDEDGWPTAAEAGEDGARAALHIAVRATSRPAFQRRCLTMMKTAVQRGELAPEPAAELAAAIRD
jgi:hypothetical protein